MSADVLLSTWLTPSRRRARFDTLLLGLPVLLLASALVWRLARLSRYLPSSTRAMTTAEASKYRCGICPAGVAHH